MQTPDAWSGLRKSLGNMSEPIAVTFSDSAPAGLNRIDEPAPAGCAYWSLAAAGKSFYTIGADHLNCPIGAYTHGAELTPEVQAQLGGMLEKMVSIKYLKMDEVPGIPRRSEPLRFVSYAPLSKALGTPDMVLVRGKARQMMLLAEAAQALGLMSGFQSMGRPACAVIAATIQSKKVTTSLGCVGNRVYTDLPDDEFYVGIPGGLLGELVEMLAGIAGANTELEQFHRSRVPANSA